MSKATPLEIYEKGTELTKVGLGFPQYEKHKTYTEVGNDRILQNAAYLKASGKPHTFRTPLIPSITDTEENLAAIRAFVGDDSWEQLPYNTLAPAKYASVGREYRYSLPETKKS